MIDGLNAARCFGRRKIKVLEERVQVEASEHLNINLKWENSKKKTKVRKRKSDIAIHRDALVPVAVPPCSFQILEDTIVDLQGKLEEEKKEKSQVVFIARKRV